MGGDTEEYIPSVSLSNNGRESISGTHHQSTDPSTPIIAADFPPPAQCYYLLHFDEIYKYYQIL